MRFKLHGRAWFEWESPDGERHQGEGITRNVSRAGAFIETQEPPAVATPVRVIVSLCEAGRQGMQARLCGIGEVRRLCNGAPESVGFGVSVVFRTEVPAEAG